MSDYQIFNNVSDADTANLAIDTLFGYPNGASFYRKNLLHPSDDRVACIIGYKLVDKCATMTSEDRLEYYDENNLVDTDYLISEGWESTIDF